jgi:tetratricopeptide (TPR) repeat protein
MRKYATRSRGGCWIRTIAFTAAACGVADFTVAGDDGVASSALQANPFYQAGMVPAPSTAPRIASSAPRIATSAPAPGSPAAAPRASVAATGPSLRRLPSMPKAAPAPVEQALSTSSTRRLPPQLPAADYEAAPANVAAASLSPTLPLESPMPTSLSATAPAPVATAPQPPPSPTNRFTLAQIERNRQDAMGPVRSQLSELEAYRLNVDDAQLGVVADQSRVLIQEGIGLAERGAFFSARSNFVSALRTIAQTLDGESPSPVHTEALAMGLDALDEADDFAGGVDARAAGVDVATVAAGHRTPALTKEQAASATPNDAMRAYYTFAAEALSRCGGSSETAAEALFQLGKLQALLVEEDNLGSTAAIPRSTALYHAALAVSPRHARAGNELGFVLAKSGDYAHARAMLQRAVASEPLAEAWHNLAIVHERLGETDLATQARDRFAAIAAVQGGADATLNPNGAPRVTWIAPETMKTPPTETFRSEAAPASPSQSNEAVRTAQPESASAGLRR